jgi:hypothetical protein
MLQQTSMLWRSAKCQCSSLALKTCLDTAHCSPNPIHRKKSFSIFPSPAGMSLTKLSLGGNNDIIYKLFPPRESLVSDIPAGDGNIEKLFLQCKALPAPFQLSICIQVWALPWKTSGQFLFIILFAYNPGQPEMEFLNMNLTKGSSLLLCAFHSLFYERI